MVLFREQSKKVRKTSLAKELIKIEEDPNTAFVEQPFKTVLYIVTKKIKSYGRFIIKIKTRKKIPGDAIKIENCLLSKSWGNVQHPHIGSRQKICFGNILSDVEKGLQSGEYYLVYSYLIELLKNPSSGLHYVSKRIYARNLKRSKKHMKILKIKKTKVKDKNGKSKNK